MDLLLLVLLLYGVCKWRTKPPKPRWMKNRQRALAAYKQYQEKHGYRSSNF